MAFYGDTFFKANFYEEIKDHKFNLQIVRKIFNLFPIRYEKSEL